MNASELAQLIGELLPANCLSTDALGEVSRRWCERHRFWHGPQHLLEMLEIIPKVATGNDREILILAALYHDAVYQPRLSNNEEASAELLLLHASNKDAREIREAVEIIRLSKWDRIPETKLGKVFFDLDTRQLSDDCPLGERLAYERAIFKEYQWAPWPVYREKRKAFLSSWTQLFPQHRRGAAECAELLSGMRPRIAVYPGSFHPFHSGHLSILRQAEGAFDKVIVAVGVNRQKLGATDTLESRHSELQHQLLFHEVAAFTGLLSAYLGELEFSPTVVRGVRDGTDLEAELRFARFLNELRPRTGVIWIGCEPELQHLSSSAIRELESIEPGAARRYVPDNMSIYGTD